MARSLLYCAIGLSVPSHEAIEFFASGRRVPAGYTGLGLASAAMGATGIVAMTGTFFLIGFDALCLVIGGLAGFVIMAVMLAPFLRKFGAFTVPSYLGRRFESKPVRIAAAALIAVPLLLLLAAELSMGAGAAAWLTGQPRGLMILLLVVAMIVTVVLGGMRSFNWSSSAQAIAALLALIVPVAIVAVMVTQLPAAAAHARPAAARSSSTTRPRRACPWCQRRSSRSCCRRGLRLGRQAIHGALRQRRPAGVRHRHADRDDGRCLPRRGCCRA